MPTKLPGWSNSIFLPAALVLAAGLLHAGEGGWIEYGACVLDAAEYADGDSFNQVVGLKSGGRRPSALNWRLYGVDCPESDLREPERVKEQARHFRVSEEEVLRWGKAAADFSRNFLAEPFFVYTRREKAGGASDKPRYYAIIVGADGRLLHEELLKAGLARAYGMPAPWPEGTTPARFEQRLKSLELGARNAKAGIWSR